MQIQSRKQMRYIYNKSSFIIMSGSMWWHSCPHVCVVTKQVDGSLDPSWPETCYDLYQLPPQPASRQWKQRARHDVHIFQEKSQPMVEVNEHTLSLFCSLSLSHTHTHTHTHKHTHTNTHQAGVLCCMTAFDLHKHQFSYRSFDSGQADDKWGVVSAIGNLPIPSTQRALLRNAKI